LPRRINGKRRAFFFYNENAVYYFFVSLFSVLALLFVLASLSPFSAQCGQPGGERSASGARKGSFSSSPPQAQVRPNPSSSGADKPSFSAFPGAEAQPRQFGQPASEQPQDGFPFLLFITL
jgi:hypothetical protein